ncbi:hypothetical protein [Argonema antarcticum]|uniref:hypothetical protein n=1 Tax=Argonema antarcticum TaxID=2942763 RepID=UPI00201216C6|nr:hypothetical protein [Argonema antarcticum]MCL1473798.1 hypothetical protein [Argonema antarcticum A004/B2]
MRSHFILKGDRFLIFHRKKKRSHPHPLQKRSHSLITKVRSHPHPSSNAIALSNSTSTIAPTSIPKSDRTLQFHKHDRTLQLNKYDRTLTPPALTFQKG